MRLNIWKSDQPIFSWSIINCMYNLGHTFMEINYKRKILNIKNIFWNYGGLIKYLFCVIWFTKINISIHFSRIVVDEKKKREKIHTHIVIICGNHSQFLWKDIVNILWRVRMYAPSWRINSKKFLIGASESVQIRH